MAEFILGSQPWRSAMVPASFRGAGFFIEQDGQAGGRRNVIFEFPKRDTPYAEDMGRRARHWSISAYVIGQTYTADRDAIIQACEQNGPGTLVHPLLGTVQANCESYAVHETREKGGMAFFELTFVESGSLTDTGATINSALQAAGAASNLVQSSISSLQSTIQGLSI